MTRRSVPLVCLILLAACMLSPIQAVAQTRVGFFTERDLECGDSLIEALVLVQEALLSEADREWIERYGRYVAGYVDQDGLWNEPEAYFTIMLASLLTDNATVFYIATVDALKLDPDNPALLNSAATVLMILGYYDLAGRVLDCAYEADPNFFHSYINAATWLDAKGEIDKALDALRRAGELRPERDHTNWEGLEYALAHHRKDAAKYFFDRLPSNYPLASSSGDCGGGGQPRYGICCACTGKMYYLHELQRCLAECKASLRCFSGICEPATECHKASPFRIGLSVCFPPSLTSVVKVCFGVDTEGTISLALEADLLGLVSGGFAVSHNFSDDTSGVSAYANVLDGGFEVDLISGEVTVTFGVPAGDYFGLSVSLPVPGTATTNKMRCTMTLERRPGNPECLCTVVWSER